MNFQKQYFGQGRSEILNRLLHVWLKDGPAVSFLEGFPGVGKTDLALELLDRAERDGKWQNTVINEVPEDPIPLMDCLMELSSRLSYQGLPEMESILWEQRTPDLSHAFEKALQRPVVIVIDQAQRFFSPSSGSPFPEIKSVFSHLRHRPSLRGRLLLLSDRLVERAKWSEWIPWYVLRELKQAEAVAMLDARLNENGISVEISNDRKTQVLDRLHYNPRAIEALVGRLESSSLDQIIEANPDLLAVEDIKIDPDFLRNLERDLLQQTMAEFADADQRRLKRLSVHRHNFYVEAFDTLGGNAKELSHLRNCLLDRFFVNFHRGSYSLNPIVREISLSHLKNDPSELKQSHSAAADYYMRPFVAKQMVGTYGKLAENFAELRYHLVQCGRHQELGTVGRRFTDYLKQEIRAETPIPAGREELDYRIGVLTLLLADGGAKGLEYHLARCLQARDKPGDVHQALFHARRATGFGRQEAPWVLQAKLTRRTEGNDAAMMVVRRGLRALSPHPEVASPLYHLGAELLADDHRVEAAFELLKQGIGIVPAERNLFTLYELGSELLCRLRRPGAALALVDEGIGRIQQQFGRQRLEICGLLLCAGSGMGNLERRIEGSGGVAVTYKNTLAQILMREGHDDWKSAGKLAKIGRSQFAREIALATHEALCHLANEEYERAINALTSFPNFTSEEGAVTAWLETFIHLRRADPDAATQPLGAYLKRKVNRASELNEAFLLRLWDEQEVRPQGNQLCFNLPFLPSSLTGIDQVVRRLQFSEPVLHPGRSPSVQRRLPISAGKKPEIYVSYAWGEDGTSDGQLRERTVSDLCSAIRASGRLVGRDRERMLPGDSIDSFAKEISAADRIVAVISAKYLNSEYCMVRELFRTYRRCEYDSAEFQEKIIAVVMPDANIVLKDRLKLTREWKDRVDRNKKALLEIDSDRQNRELWHLTDLMEEMVIRLPGMLQALEDILMPRNFQELAANDFQDILGRLP